MNFELSRVSHGIELPPLNINALSCCLLSTGVSVLYPDGIENAPSVGMLVNESLFPPSSSEPAIFNDPGGATNLTFKVEPNVMSPELPQVSEEVRVPMDTGDCPPSKISKISECVSPG